MTFEPPAPSKAWPLCMLVVLGILCVLAWFNISGREASFERMNEQIVQRLSNTEGLDMGPRLRELKELREMQEKALAGDPAEPFGWARLSYLRLATQGDQQGAFAALRLSDLVSPGEPRQLPERAYMWRQFAAIEDKDQRAYQTVLWQKAFRMQREATWNLALHNDLIDEVGEALKQAVDEPGLYGEWQSRVAKVRK
ncbi:MAG: hypothetical protein AB7H77_06965 [Bdellovibrionales bacterium]